MGLAPESMDNFNHAYRPILEGRDHDSGLLLERDRRQRPKKSVSNVSMCCRVSWKCQATNNIYVNCR